MFRSLRALAILLTLCITCLSQGKYGTDVRLDRTKPSVFITYEGKTTEAASSNPRQTVLLRLRNNSVWSVIVDTVGCRTLNEECGLFYTVHTRGFGVKAPLSERESCHVCAAKRISPQESVLFSIPANHLTKELFISVEFNYEWEKNTGGSGTLDNLHRVSFFGEAVPTEKK
jgi:hypothetical protein